MESAHLSSMREEPNNVINHINPIRSTGQTLAFSYETNNLVLAPGDQVNDAHEPEVLHKDFGRERLRKHCEEVAGRVMIPDTWGQENLLMDWIDYSSFDKLLAPDGIVSARKALAAEGRRANSQVLRIQSMC